jgi:hypothetical protein
MPYTQTRVVNAHYYVVERLSENFKLDPTPWPMLRSIRVLKSESPAFFEKLGNAVRSIFGLSPQPAGLQNATASYHDLIRNGVLRNVIFTLRHTPLVGDGADVVLSQTPPVVPNNDAAFCHFENTADPSYVDLFFFSQPAQGFGAVPPGTPIDYDCGVYLGHSIIGGPVGGIPYSVAPPPVPVEPPVPPAPVP